MEEAIRDNSLIAVTDGSYIKELFPNVNLAAFVLVCSKGRGRLIGTFPEQTMAACAYRGELLGLLAIHLLLLSISTKSTPSWHPGWLGTYLLILRLSRCSRKSRELSTSTNSIKSRHSDILKTILVNCTDLIYGAKCEPWDFDPDYPPVNNPFRWNLSVCLSERRR